MRKYKSPIPKVDVIIEKEGKVLLIRRGKEPFRGMLALPGGYIDYGETVEHAAVREAKEETSLDVKLTDILGVYSDPGRDPRHHGLGIIFIGKIVGGRAKGGDDAAETIWIDIDEIEDHEFAFDHRHMLMDYLKWRKQKGTYWSTKK